MLKKLQYPTPTYGDEPENDRGSHDPNCRVLTALQRDGSFFDGALVASVLK
jgi:hypothetical protein